MDTLNWIQFVLNFDTPAERISAHIYNNGYFCVIALFELTKNNTIFPGIFWGNANGLAQKNMIDYETIASNGFMGVCGRFFQIFRRCVQIFNKEAIVNK